MCHLDPSFAHVGLLVSSKRDQRGFGGPRDNFEGRTQKFWLVFGAHPPLNVMSWAFFMRFIDPRIFDFNHIHRPHPGPQENMQIGGVRYVISQIWPKFREMLGENPADIHL